MCFYGFSDDVNSLVLLKNSLISTIKNSHAPESTDSVIQGLPRQERKKLEN
jgi:hypothetical protein